MDASVVTGCDASPVFELCKQVFYPMPGFLCCVTVIDGFLAVFLWPSAWRHVLRVRHVADFGAVASTILDEGFDLRQIPEQNIRPLEVAALPAPSSVQIVT